MQIEIVFDTRFDTFDTFIRRSKIFENGKTVILIEKITYLSRETDKGCSFGILEVLSQLQSNPYPTRERNLLV